jgi:hypothetical protein
VDKAVAGFFAAGAKLLESLAAESSNNPLEQLLSSLFKRDPVTQQSTLSIPLPESFNPDRLVKSISSLLIPKAERRD